METIHIKSLQHFLCKQEWLLGLNAICPWYVYIYILVYYWYLYISLLILITCTLLNQAFKSEENWSFFCDFYFFILFTLLFVLKMSVLMALIKFCTHKKIFIDYIFIKYIKFFIVLILKTGNLSMCMYIGLYHLWNCQMWGSQHPEDFQTQFHLLFTLHGT